MKRTLLTSIILLSSSLVACGDGGDGVNTYAGTVVQEQASTLEAAATCDAETPCPDGLDCMYIDAFSEDTAVCVDLESACDLLDCGDGECLILESYPGQMMCAGPDGDEEYGECSIDDDGNSNC